MTICHKAYLVDPHAGTIKAVAIDKANSYEELRKLINCQCIDSVMLDAETAIYCDDDGLHEGLTACTQLKGYANALAAKLVMLRPVMDPNLEHLTGPDVFGDRLTGFTLRIQKDRYTPV